MLWILASLALALLCYEIPTLIGAVLWPLWNNPNALQTDFHYYYDAAQRFGNGGPLYQASDDVIAGFAYPPPAIAPFMALTTLPLGAALLVFTIASAAALGVSAQLWLAHLRRSGVVIDRRTAIAIAVIAVALGPSYMNLMIGQVNAFVLASAIGFVWLAPLVPLAAAMLLAAGIWLKVYPLALVAIGAWDARSRKALVWTMPALAAIAVALLPLVPWSAYQSFVIEVLPARIDKTAIHITNQSLVAFLERFRYPAHLFLNWTGEQAVTVGVAARVISWGVAIATLALLWRRAKAGHHAMSAAGVIALIAVLAPLGWGHTYVMVLPLVMLQLAALRTASTTSAVVVGLCVIALMLPAGRHLPLDFAPAWLQNLVYSRYLVATFALLLLDLDTREQRA